MMRHLRVKAGETYHDTTGAQRGQIDDGNSRYCRSYRCFRTSQAVTDRSTHLGMILLPRYAQNIMEYLGLEDKA